MQGHAQLLLMPLVGVLEELNKLRVRPSAHSPSLPMRIAPELTASIHRAKDEIRLLDVAVAVDPRPARYTRLRPLILVLGTGGVQVVGLIHTHPVVAHRF